MANRCRFRDIPPHIQCIVAPPRMQLYIDCAAAIYKVFLKYLAPEDIYVYSIDEAFLDVTPYLKMYVQTSKELAKNVSIIGTRIDEGYRTVENICLKLLLRQQPVARDLRVISAAMKMITDMERIGDQAEDIVDLVPRMEHRADEKYPKIREMAKAAKAMVTEAVDAYVRQDLQLAYAVMQHDDIVDDYFDRVKAGIIGIIAGNPTEGEYALDLLMIAKYFERIGDHCTNIAEWVEFSVTGTHRDCQ